MSKLGRMIAGRLRPLDEVSDGAKASSVQMLDKINATADGRRGPHDEEPWHGISPPVGYSI